eukprot:COSAG01_NODE_42447_length_440_cov_0.612903_2_plen_27_part_01
MSKQEDDNISMTGCGSDLFQRPDEPAL